MTTDQERLDQIAARTEAATPGLWHADDEHGDLGDDAVPSWCVSLVGNDGSYLTDLAYTVGSEEEPNAEFIAAAREDVPWLLSVVRDQAEQITALQERVDKALAICDETTYEVQCNRTGCECGDWFSAVLCVDLRDALADVPTEGELT